MPRGVLPLKISAIVTKYNSHSLAVMADLMESPPSAKKSSSMPTRSTPSIFSNAEQSAFCKSVSGATYSFLNLPASTSGRADLSNLPLALTGSLSSFTKNDGIIYDGSF